MFTPSRSRFKKLAEKYNLIPVFREIIADIDTPVSAFQKIEPSEYAFLLESVEGGERLGRYSFLGSKPFLIITARNNRVVIEGEYKKAFEVVDPLNVVKETLARFKPAFIEGLPSFYGGAVGFVGYDAVRYFENIPRTSYDDLELPDIAFMLTDSVVIFDHLKHKIKIVVNARINGSAAEAYEKAVARIDQLISRLRKPLSYMPLAEMPRVKPKEFTSNLSKADFTQMVKKAKKYIGEGEIFQVVLSQRFAAPLRARPFDIYRVLRTINPSPYMVFLKFGDLILAGTSPEPLVKVEGDRVITRPIAGTRRRGTTSEEELALEGELLTDEKERAEHIMLVDLGRNDLGRVCRAGTVKVEELMKVEKYSHVMHLVSTVGGVLCSDKDAFAALKACFPAGTVSGAPKIRAMEIIDELEPTLRGPYAGIYGYFSFSGNLDCGITIRTIIIKDKQAFVQAGAGIVADSDPGKEFEETVSKAKALLAAIDIAEQAGI
jgi:anthranilate synthase component 1